MVAGRGTPKAVGVVRNELGGGPHVPTRDETCKRPACQNPRRPYSGHGRPPAYCSPWCAQQSDREAARARWHASQERKRGPVPRAEGVGFGGPMIEPTAEEKAAAWRAAERRRNGL